MRNLKLTLAALALAAAAAIPASSASPLAAQTPAAAPSGGNGPGVQVVAVPSAGSPLVAVRLMFDAGSIYDPPGKEGLAALTAQMIGQSGTAKRSYKDLVEALYPMAAAIDSNADREVAVFFGQVHKDKLADYTTLLEEAVLQPGFAQADFERNKEQLLAYLTTTLRAADDELLGLEAIQDAVFARHPYGHPTEGTVAGLKGITLDDVKNFYREHYTRAGLILGVAGGYPAGYVEKLEKDLGALPAGQAGRKPLPPAPQVSGRNFQLIEKETASVGIHFGYPLPVNRADADYYPLMVANSFLGEHRTFHGRLQQQLRQARGLNYGNYSYVEFWLQPPRTSKPSPGVPRREQFFSVWIRPVVPNTAHFALRDALYEVNRLRDKGLTQAEFDLTREFLLNYSKLWGQTLRDRLGFQMDSRYYGMPSYLDEIQARLPKLNLDDVNRAARKYFQTENYDAVIVTAKAADFKATLQKDQPSPMKYNSQPSPEVQEADKTIEALPVKPTSIEIVPVSQVFEK